MAKNDDFRIRPGRIRSTRGARTKSFLAQVLTAAQKAGGLSRSGVRRGSTFGRGRAASLAASRLLNNRARGAIVKARVVRRMRSPGALRAHIGYLQRDGVTRDGAPGKLFDAAGDEADGRAFAERCEGDRHHFRFIVSPDDAAELESLRTFTRELMNQAARDLGTRLDWVAVDHWNTEHPHIHILVRGRDDDGKDLVISRDYISTGLRARAVDLVTRELGPRSELEIRQNLDRDVAAERWTRLDRALAREASAADGVIDLRPDREAARDPLREIRIGRMRTLERLGLAEPAGPARWVLAADAEQRLRELGERGDIIKRLHRSLTKDGATRAPSSWALEGEHHGEPLIGRLVGHGLDDELKGTAFAIVDGIDGRVHHLKLPDIEAAGDGPIGGIVELRRFEDTRGRQRIALAVRSDLSLDQQVAAEGATWLDRRLVARDPVDLSRAGFGAEVRAALDRRIDVLAEQGLARRDGDKITLGRNLIGTLRNRELEIVGRRLASETGLTHLPAEAGEAVTGTYRQRLSLASGRFAMIDNGLGFQLVPWLPSLERELGRQVNGIAGPGGVDWSFGRKRDLSL
ncbi:type VI secretion protein [Bradyrhizobium sp. CCBAU 11386]|uniref:relaxase/mobilization nuclease domain-containing protein n=1 Tax=unclassified Bradyrhizobium TaxID=2631580 RepID=UPI0023047EC5|nr:MULTISPECIES: VirD2 family relaxase/mobilization nuclease [unclassified Bradyrhizobium]MDA9495145.1 type VI secretion protein [Bradyrhizobium sp. CCBAU 11361]MDA9505826.1 type VI secretion protein [Bradyrhizobium sp. CCBAU 11386]